MIAKLAAVACAAVMLLATSPSYAASCPGPKNKQICCGARSCTGRVLSNRDRHNCKVKSHGKSWHAKNGRCVNL
jgi:hypothetical protein